MFQTIVLSAAALIGVAICALLLFARHQSDLNLRQRMRAAEAGGRPLSIDEAAAIKVRGIRPPHVDDSGSGRYGRYRQSNALNRTHAFIGALFLCYMVVFGIAVYLLGFPLGFITMYLFGQVVVCLYVLRRRRSQRGE